MLNFLWGYILGSIVSVGMIGFFLGRPRDDEP